MAIQVTFFGSIAKNCLDLLEMNTWERRWARRFFHMCGLSAVDGAARTSTDEELVDARAIDTGE